MGLLRWLLLKNVSLALREIEDGADPAAALKENDLTELTTRLSRRRRSTTRHGARELDAQVAEKLALALWYRYLHQPDGPIDDLARALSVFRLLYPVAPDLVPPVLVALFDPDDQTEPDESDLDTLADCVRDLLVHAAGSDPELQRYARILAMRAFAATRRITEREPDRRGELAIRLLIKFQLDEQAVLDKFVSDEALEAEFTEHVLNAAADLPGFWDHATGGRDNPTVFNQKFAFAHWYRYLYLPDGPVDDLPLAIAVFRKVYAVDPGAVPVDLLPLFEPGARTDEWDAGDLRQLACYAQDLFSYAESGDGVGQSVQDAITLVRAATTEQDRLAISDPAVRADLARALVAMAKHTGDADVLDQAVAQARAALAGTAEADEDWLDRAALLGDALLELVEAGRAPTGLNEVVTLLRPAVRAADARHPHIVWAATVLIRALVECHAPAGPDLGQVLPELHSLVALIPDDLDGHDLMVAGILGMQASHLLLNGDISGLAELGPAIKAQLDRLEPGTEAYDVLQLSMAGARVGRHVVRGTPVPDADLRWYRELLRTSAALPPDRRAGHVDVFSAYLIGHAELTSDRQHLDEVVGLLSDEMRRLPAESDEHRQLAERLGTALVSRYRVTSNRADLDNAIPLLRQRLAGLPDDHVDRSTAVSNLGDALREHFVATADPDSYRRAMVLLRQSVDDRHAPLSVRLADAASAGLMAGRARHWDEATTMLSRWAAASAGLAWRGLDRVDQERNLVNWAGTVNEAAAAAVRSGDPTRAVELLEQSRAVLFHQALDSRDETARVRNEHPDLAVHLDLVQQQLATTNDRSRRHLLAGEWDELVTQVRSRPGLDGFLRSPEFAALRPADGQTVVVINPADFGSGAFLVTSAGVRVVPLPALTTSDVRDRVTAFQSALATRTGSTADYDERRTATGIVVDVLDWLWRTTAEPVLAALGHDRPPPDGAPWPTVHWCPTWMLSFLPLHASAARPPALAGASVLDRVVSSYALSLRSLAYAGRQRDPAPRLRGQLVVAMPDTPALPALPGARQELATLTALPGRTTVLTGDQAVHGAVREALRSHAWVHFACHAAQDLREPSQGRLFLHDHQTSPFTVLDISRLRLEHATLAFLSACDTARGGLQLPDEALHLGGALQLAGYQHVIATLWPVSDTIAATLTERVYRRLRSDNCDGLDPASSASALHEAVRTLRTRYSGDPALWASYVHIGP